MDDTFGFDPDPLLEDVDDALEGAVKTVSYQPGEDVVLRNCMFKRSGYVLWAGTQNRTVQADCTG